MCSLWKYLFVFWVSTQWHSAHSIATPDHTNWPSWRGPTGNGTAPEKCKPPTEWSEEKNIIWKKKVPGLGHSTPVIWGNQIYVTSAVPFGEKKDPPVPDNAPGSHDNLPVSQMHRFIVLCMDRGSGKVLWTTKCKETLSLIHI